MIASRLIFRTVRLGESALIAHAFLRTSNALCAIRVVMIVMLYCIRLLNDIDGSP